MFNRRLSDWIAADFFPISFHLTWPSFNQNLQTDKNNFKKNNLDKTKTIFDKMAYISNFFTDIGKF